MITRRTIGRRQDTRKIYTVQQGKWIQTYETEPAFSLAAGSSVTIEEFFQVKQHPRIHLHTWLDAEVTLTIEWKSDPRYDWITSPNSIVIPATAVGSTHDISIAAPYYRITALNSDTIPLTFLKISVYGSR